MLRLVACLFVAAWTASAAAAQAAPAQSPAPMLAPGDILKVTVWREEDLTGEFVVDESGMATLPLLGERRVVGIPFVELREQLVREYRVELQNPSIEIIPMRRIYVLGEVNEPGIYTIDLTTSLAGAVAMAGGATPAGDLRRIRVLRDGQDVLRRVDPEAALQGTVLHSGDQVFVGERSWFARNSTFIISVLLSATSIVISIIR